MGETDKEVRTSNEVKEAFDNLRGQLKAVRECYGPLSPEFLKIKAQMDTLNWVRIFWLPFEGNLGLDEETRKLIMGDDFK